MDKILRRKQVEEVTGLARSTIYERMKAGTFPKAIPLGGRAVGWLERDIQSWQASCISTAAGGEVVQ